MYIFQRSHFKNITHECTFYKLQYLKKKILGEYLVGEKVLEWKQRGQSGSPGEKQSWLTQGFS